MRWLKHAAEDDPLRILPAEEQDLSAEVPTDADSALVKEYHVLDGGYVISIPNNYMTERMVMDIKALEGLKVAITTEMKSDADLLFINTVPEDNAAIEDYLQKQGLMRAAQ